MARFTRKEQRRGGIGLSVAEAQKVERFVSCTKHDGRREGGGEVEKQSIEG